MILCATLNWGFGYLIIHDAASKMPLNALMFSRYLIASGVLILIFRKRFAPPFTIAPFLSSKNG